MRVLFPNADLKIMEGKFLTQFLTQFLTSFLHAILCDFLCVQVCGVNFTRATQAHKLHKL